MRCFSGKKGWAAIAVLAIVLLVAGALSKGLVQRLYVSLRLRPWFLSHLKDGQGFNSSQSGGVSIGLIVDTGEYVRERQTTYLVYEDDQAQKEVAATWRMRSDFPQTETFALVVLVDYAQVPIIIDDVPHETHVFRADPGDPLEIDFGFTVPNRPGKHQVCVVLFQGVDTHRLDDRFRFGQGLVATHISDVIIGGDDVPPEITYQKASYARPDDPDYDISGVNLNRDPQVYRQSWVTETVRPGEVLEYCIHLGNESDQDKPYALVAWLDWQQIPVGQGETPAFYGQIKAREQQAITTAVAVPTTGQIHELQVLYVKHPYHPPQDLPRPRSSLRVALIPND